MRVVVVGGEGFAEGGGGSGLAFTGVRHGGGGGGGLDLVVVAAIPIESIFLFVVLLRDEVLSFALLSKLDSGDADVIEPTGTMDLCRFDVRRGTSADDVLGSGAMSSTPRFALERVI